MISGIMIITVCETLIIKDITKTESINRLLYTVLMKITKAQRRTEHTLRCG